MRIFSSCLLPEQPSVNVRRAYIFCFCANNAAQCLGEHKCILFIEIIGNQSSIRPTTNVRNNENIGHKTQNEVKTQTKQQTKNTNKTLELTH